MRFLIPIWIMIGCQAHAVVPVEPAEEANKKFLEAYESAGRGCVKYYGKGYVVKVFRKTGKDSYQVICGREAGK